MGKSWVSCFFDSRCICAACAQVAASGRCRSTGQTDGRTDGWTDTRPLHRLCTEYCAGSVNNVYDDETSLAYSC